MYVTFEDLKEVLRRLDELEREVVALKDRRPRYGIDHTAIPRFAKERMEEMKEDDGA